MRVKIFMLFISLASSLQRWLAILLHWEETSVWVSCGVSNHCAMSLFKPTAAADIPPWKQWDVSRPGYVGTQSV